MKYLPRFLFSMLLVTTSFAFAENMPEAPPGYKWYESKKGVGIFLKPKGWFVMEDRENGTKALFITKQKLKKNKVFVTGLTVNQIPDFHKNTGQVPSEYAKGVIDKLVAQNKPIKMFNVARGKSLIHGVQVRSLGAGPPTRLHYLAYGDDLEDTLYLIWFEAPEIAWEVEFRIAGPILNMFLLGN